MTYQVLFTRESRSHLREIRSYIQKESSPEIARRFVSALYEHCMQLATFPNRGVMRDEIRPGLRVIGFRGRVSIHFVVHDQQIRILAFHYAGYNWHADYIDEV